MKILFLILLLCSNSVLSEGFNTEPQSIETIDIPSGYKKVSYNNKYTLAIPNNFNIEQSDFRNELFVVRSFNGKGAIMLDEFLASNKVFLIQRAMG